METGAGSTNENYSLIILAGGRSSRMGRDKCYLEYKGKTFLDIQINKGIELGIRDIIVSGNNQYNQQYNGNVRFVQDNLCDRGPLGGLEACLRAAINERCIVVCADTPFITIHLLQNLIDQRNRLKGPVVACEHKGKQEPLLGIYDASLADEMLSELQNRKGSVFAFLNRIGCVWLNMDAYDACFYNINVPEDYEKLCCGRSD